MTAYLSCRLAFWEYVLAEALSRPRLQDTWDLLYATANAMRIAIGRPLLEYRAVLGPFDGSRPLTYILYQ